MLKVPSDLEANNNIAETITGLSDAHFFAQRAQRLARRFFDF